MPKIKYIDIYKDLKRKIENGTYEFQELLPSENYLIKTYECSRNTIRRAISTLVSDGYVQAMQGKGVRNIFQPTEKVFYKIGSIESAKESAMRSQQIYDTNVVYFTTLITDKAISERTGFPIGSELYHLQRVHYWDGTALTLNISFFLKDIVTNLTPEIAKQSIYEYFENELHISIVNSKRTMTVEKMTETDEKYLNLGEYNCVAVVTSQTYNKDGIMFEYTQSRHHPDYFSFQDNALRRIIYL